MTEIVAFHPEDPEMAAAIAEARGAFPEFRAALEADWQRVIPCLANPLIKAVFSSPATGAHEHMWIRVDRFDGDTVVGHLANEPDAIPELAEGDVVQVAADQITDWIYWDGDQQVGGYTVALVEREDRDGRD